MLEEVVRNRNETPSSVLSVRTLTGLYRQNLCGRVSLPKESGPPSTEKLRMPGCVWIVMNTLGGRAGDISPRLPSKLSEGTLVLDNFLRPFQNTSR